MIKVSAWSNFSSLLVFIKKFSLAELVLKRHNAFPLIKTLFRIKRVEYEKCMTNSSSLHNLGANRPDTGGELSRDWGLIVRG